MACQESEYLDDQKKCVPCRKCMPGQELSKDCGDGSGGDAQCVACPPRKFKDRWGHHGCKPCLSCALINRVQKSNCTATADAVCGECLPGFYRKARISGQLEWECIPCTKQTPSSEPQCRSRTNLVKVAVPTVPPQDTALLALTSSALVIIVLVLLALSIIYCKRFWKSQCQRVFLRTQNFSGQRATFPTAAAPGRFLCEEQMSGPCCLGVKNLSPCYRQAEGPVEAVQFISDGEAVGLQLPSLQPEMDLPPAIAASTASKAQLGRSLLESQPLIRASGHGDCLEGVLPPPAPRQGTVEALAPLSSCASEMQHKWPHAPVECTELDLQKFSSQAEFVGAERLEDTAGRAGRRIPAESSAGVQERAHHLPTAETPPGEQPVDDAQSLVTQISSTASGLPIAELPHSLVQSLAFLLDPSLNGVKNFSHVALELGLMPQLLGRISGFEQLVAHFTSAGAVVTVPLLARALQRLQRVDALLLLCDHFTLSPAPDRQR
ncbi:tumor necrosis factor receptor superfamily member 27 [Ammospiza nelsoni]|uniref:tumor necrosis factor receptor superfamily member 27 n=1 Tax=Melospiza georgiana TaxID=44398 RepID=UPI0025AC8155|nr:tumor necrosis factor receptor superfamily member 27 [Melospiza georgiana]XP_059339190.1 tumor necrosis factor receptor superfamily member 27 [Ammospiza nelsoni]